jgi:HK97 family phage prohead protease
MAETKPDFKGYVTRYGVKCTDGRTILAHAFKGDDGEQIPLVWQHQHDDPTNVLGHLILRHVDDGVRVDGFFNDTEYGKQAKALVKHKDIKALSIFANQLVQKGMDVLKGKLREGSLVMAGANPGAFIDFINLQHADGSMSVADDEAVIYNDSEIELVIEHAAGTASKTVAPPKKVAAPKGNMPKPTADNPDPDGDGDNDLFDPKDGGLGPDASVKDVLETMTPQQKQVVYAMIGSLQQSATNPDNQDQKGDDPVTRNVFDQTDAGKAGKSDEHTLTHSDIQGIFAAAHKGGSLKAAVEEYALAHGIDDISTLFPYDQAVTATPEFISRRMEWVNGVLTGTHKTPFSRIRSWTADITFQEARAKGYIKGNLKKEEFFRIARRITTPQTIYKKQKLDRDDILDITEFDVVNWLQTEMRLMLDEELARAILIGDGRDVDDADKIDTANVRPIYGDDDMYVTPVQVAQSAITTSADSIVDAVVNAMRFYRGSGNPTLFTTRIWLAKLLLIKDTLGRRIYATMEELQAALGVSNIVACEALESKPELIGLVVNLQDYTVGADKGGEVSMFDFFDIDYNQFKYLMETRVSGAMTKYRGALALTTFTGAGGLLPDPAAPTFDEVTGIGTVPDPSGLHYTYVTVAEDGTQSSALTAGAQSAIAAGAYVTYRAVPASTYEFSTDNFEWTFRRDS